MSYYVEVMCDERKDWPREDGRFYGIYHRCVTDRGDNPQGNTVAAARKEALGGGWKVRGNYACCPDCLKPDADLRASS